MQNPKNGQGLEAQGTPEEGNDSSLKIRKGEQLNPQNLWFKQSRELFM